MIRINNLSKHFGRKQILNNVNLYAPEGTCIGILGQNGCGKSTLMSVLAGTISKDSGEFFLDGRDLFQDRRQHASCVGYVPQGIPLIEELSGMDNLLYLIDIQKKATKEDVLALAERLRLDGLNKKYKTYSLGMRQKMRLIQALVEKPDYMILDEPFDALDEKTLNGALAFANRCGAICAQSKGAVCPLPPIARQTQSIDI